MRNKALALAAVVVPYFPWLRPLGKTVEGCILMTQLDHWFSHKPDGFYKFLEPCPHHRDYKPGDSWTEELQMSAGEFRTAFDKIGVRYESKRAYDEAGEDKFQGRFYCSYHDKIKCHTFYFRNHPLVDAAIDALLSSAPSPRKLGILIYGDNESPSTEMRIPNVEILTETTPEITTEITTTPTPPHSAPATERSGWSGGFSLEKDSGFGSTPEPVPCLPNPLPTPAPLRSPAPDPTAEAPGPRTWKECEQKFGPDLVQKAREDVAKKRAEGMKIGDEVKYELPHLERMLREKAHGQGTTPAEAAAPAERYHIETPEEAQARATQQAKEAAPRFALGESQAKIIKEQRAEQDRLRAMESACVPDTSPGRSGPGGARSGAARLLSPAPVATERQSRPRPLQVERESGLQRMGELLLEGALAPQMLKRSTSQG